MKNFTKKSILQKTIIAIILALLLSNFIVPTYSHADIGGVLMDPVTDFLCTIGDAVINVLQRCMTGDWGTGFRLDGGFLENAKDYDFDETITKDNANEAIDPNGDHPFNKTIITKNVQDYYIPVATYSPEQIFAGNVEGLDINFINPNFKGEYEKDSDGNIKKDSEGNPIPLSSAAKLQPTIATWYVALRNLTVVGLLSVLVYVGIRIIILSTASDKAKYKQMLMDWLVALCLVFFLHYIMSFTLTLVDSITNAIAGNGEETYTIYVEGQDGGFSTNLLGAARFKTQYDDFGSKMAYLIMYLALVIYTCIFTFFYLKRLLMMAFLTLIAPVVALTYPIDKMNDGKAQAFDSWLKEYVFNALIQPFHLIIYTVFVGSAMDLASNNIIYMIAALAFIMPAEKILRKFFGFEKAGAGTLGALAGGFTAASLLKGLEKGKGGGGKAPAGKPAPEGEKPPRFENKHDISEIEDGNTGNGTSGGPSAADANAGNEGEDPTERMRREALEEQLADGQVSESELTAEQRRLLGRESNPNPNTNQNPNTNEDSNDKPNRAINWARAHNINGRSAGRLAGRAISGVAKFGTRTAFKAGTGTLAAAVALASGSGFAGASAAFMAGSNVGGRLGNAAVNLGTTVGHGAARVGRALYADATAANSEEGLRAAENALLGGTALGREIDLANGNTRYQDAGGMTQFKNNKDNVQYLREQMAAQNGGTMPSAQEVRDKMNSLDPYIAEGLTDIKDMLKAQKAEQYGVSSKQAAIIAAIGKERGITADILNDSKKAEAQQSNLRQDFINKGYSQAAATKQADYTMNVLKVQNGVANNMKKSNK